MKVNSDEAVEFFNTRGYLVINSSRASGKTTTLKRIIEENPNLQIVVKCPTLKMYDTHYKEYTNCTYFHKYTIAHQFDIIIGDEVHIEPVAGQRTACAYTQKYVELCLDMVYIDLRNVERHKYPEQYEIEFGQYLE